MRGTQIVSAPGVMAAGGRGADWIWRENSTAASHARGERLAARPVEERISALAAAAQRARRLRHAQAAREIEDEAALQNRRPAVAAGADRHGLKRRKDRSMAPFYRGAASL